MKMLQDKCKKELEDLITYKWSRPFTEKESSIINTAAECIANVLLHVYSGHPSEPQIDGAFADMKLQRVKRLLGENE